MAKGISRQVCLTVPPEFVDRIDVEAKKELRNRSGYVTWMLAQHFAQLDESRLCGSHGKNDDPPIVRPELPPSGPAGPGSTKGGE